MAYFWHFKRERSIEIAPALILLLVLMACACVVLCR